MTEQNSAPAPRTVLTLDQKIDAARAKLAKLLDLKDAEVREAAAAAAFAAIAAGYVVTFSVGRGDTKREVVGTVIGRGVVNDKDSVKVQVGEGLEASLYTVAVASIASYYNPNEPAAEPQASEEQADPLSGADANALLDTVQLS